MGCHFLLIPAFLLAGYPLLRLEEYITGIDGGEKYSLGVLTYLGVPATAGYLSLAFVYYKYKGTNILKSRLLIAFIYFIITIICGFAMLIIGYGY